MKSILKNKYILWIASILVILLAIFGIKSAIGTSIPKSATEIKRGTLVQEVSLTGIVKPLSDVSLAFEKSGRVAEIYRDVGNRVAQGGTLASLNSETERANVDEAQAKLLAEKAKLDELVKGTRQEEIAVKEAQVAEARAARVRLESEASTALADAYNTADEAVHRYTDLLFTNPNSMTPTFTYGMPNTQESIRAESERLRGIVALANIKELGALKGSTDSRLFNVSKELRVVKTYLESISAGLDKSTLSTDTKNVYRKDVDAARANVANSIEAIEESMEDIVAADLNRSRVEQELALLKAPATAETIEQQRQKIAQAEALLKSAKAELAKRILYSPISGTVTEADIEVGELVSANSPVFTVIQDSGWLIESNVAEVDIGKLKVGSEATVSLDAYGPSETWKARITSIDPAEKEIEGVPTYKTTLSLEAKDARIRSGMTANITIEVLRKEGALIIPARALIYEDTSTYAEKISHDGEAERVLITTGARGKMGDVEVLTGLSEGDLVNSSPEFK